MPVFTLFCQTSYPHSSSLSTILIENTGPKMKDTHYSRIVTCEKLNLGKIVKAGLIKSMLQVRQLVFSFFIVPDQLQYHVLLFVCVSLQLEC
jgi:hypothetical protein